jgi:tyrosyl-DNA phosphodiesterase 2
MSSSPAQTGSGTTLLNAIPKLSSKDTQLAVPQDAFLFKSTSNTWESYSHTAHSSQIQPSLPTFDGTNLYFLTWNVDFSSAFEQKRMKCALDYIQELITRAELPTMVVLQEVDPRCFDVILQDKFIREHYAVTDIDPRNWVFETYGTVSLIPLTLLDITTSVFRVRFPGSKMGRDALHVDIQVPTPPSSNEQDKIYRFTNVHLESLRGHGDIERVEQMEGISRHLSTGGIRGGVVGGDMNAIAPSDADLPAQFGLKDAWLGIHQDTRKVVQDRLEDELVENNKESEEDYTWGYQPPCKFPPNRLDKILLKGNIVAEAIERVGVGLAVEITEGTGVWVSDHYGLLAKLRLD